MDSVGGKHVSREMGRGGRTMRTYEVPARRCLCAGGEGEALDEGGLRWFRRGGFRLGFILQAGLRRTYIEAAIAAPPVVIYGCST